MSVQQHQELYIIVRFESEWGKFMHVN